MCPSCGKQCRKHKAGDRLLKDALRWPFNPYVKEPKVPKQLSSLVKKCPQWEEKISKLIESNQNYRHFSYKQMEQEISQREIVKAAWQMLAAKSASLVERIQRRDTKLDETTSFLFFLFIGQVYLWRRVLCFFFFFCNLFIFLILLQTRYNT